MQTMQTIFFLAILFVVNAKLKYTNLNTKQLKFKNYINDDNYPIVLGVGPPGTGKTLIATYEAINALESKKYDKIIIQIMITL
jgi:phosphate starvation-inducible protein PhoH